MLNAVDFARRKFQARREEQKEACSDARLIFFPMEASVYCLQAGKSVDRAAYDYARALHHSGKEGQVAEAFAKSMHLCSTARLDGAVLMSRNFLLPATFHCAAAQKQVTLLARRELEKHLSDSSRGV